MKHILVIAIILFSISIHGQDFEMVRKQIIYELKEVLEKENFEIGKCKMTNKHEKVFFETEIIPQKEGVFFIQHQFEQRIGTDTFVYDYRNIIKVGKKGVSRYLSGRKTVYESNNCWIGDTIILSVVWMEYMLNNKFTMGKETGILGEVDSTFKQYRNKQPNRQHDWNFVNHVEELKIIDTVSSYAVFRSLTKFGVNHNIIFEAIKPGKFVLEVGEASLVVNIHPKNKVLKIANHIVIGRVSYSYRSGSSYNAKNTSAFPESAELRVGDILQFTFMSYIQHRNEPEIINTDIEIKKVDASKE